MRQYSLIVLGATGYTGRLCAEHISTTLPTDLRWAVAGRSEAKLFALTERLRKLNPDRAPNGTEVTTLNSEELDILAKKTQVLINTVGPYYLHGTPVIEACANNGTHYLDVTGESPWVLEMIHKYHQTAKTNHAIIIPQIGIESAPSDLLVFFLTRIIRIQHSLDTAEVIGCVHEAKGLPSGGTLATVLGIIDHYGFRGIAKAAGSWASSPIPGPKFKTSPPLMSRIFGIRSVPGLGTLTTSISTGPNVATVQRSWGLLDNGQAYGPRFSYHEYAAVRNRLVGMAVHFALIFGTLALALPPIRRMVRMVLYAPGQGATRQATSKDAIEFRALATADQDGSSPKRAIGKLRWDGGNYYFTGVCLAEAAMVLLKDDDLVKRLDGGLLTPAMIAKPFIDRMTDQGMVFESRILP